MTERYTVKELIFITGTGQKKAYAAMQGVPTEHIGQAINKRKVPLYTMQEFKDALNRNAGILRRPPVGYCPMSELKPLLAIEYGAMKRAMLHPKFPKPEGTYFPNGSMAREINYYSIKACQAFMKKHGHELSEKKRGRPEADGDIVVKVPPMYLQFQKSLMGIRR